MRHELEKLKTDFLEYLEIEKNRSRLTLRSYDHYLERFLGFAREYGVLSPAKIDLDLVRRFRLWLNRYHDGHGRELKLATQNYHIIAIRSFLKYLARRDVETLAAEKLELPKIATHQVEFLESADLERLLAAPQKTRDRAILELLFSTGLRVAELSGLKRDTINLRKDEFAIRGKGSKLRLVFLSERAKAALQSYLKERADNSPALFIRETKNLPIDDLRPLSPRSIQRLIKKYALLAGINSKITPHTLRHTMATDLLAAGADLRSVQEILGHASITTTQVYTHVTNRRLKEVHHRFHGKSIKTRVSN